MTNNSDSTHSEQIGLSGVEIHVDIAPGRDVPPVGTLPDTGASLPGLVMLLAVVLLAAGVALRSRRKPRG